jgi:undecaprenyl-diphosphatase
LVVLAIVQGITEFLPISSSGHLILVPIVFGWPDQGLMLDVAVHVGTLGAVMLYFWRDMAAMAVGLVHLAGGKWNAGAKLALMVIIATVPVVLVGFELNRYYPEGIRGMVVIGWATLGFGVLLYVADRLGATTRRVEGLGAPHAMVIGLSQVFALIPGTSRSGITMTAARMLGFDRSEAARFSLLLSIPTILGAGLLKGKELYEAGNAQLTSDAVTAAGLALVSALVAIWAMMRWLRRATFTPFVVYRILLGLVLLVFAYGVNG